MWFDLSRVNFGKATQSLAREADGDGKLVEDAINVAARKNLELAKISHTIAEAMREFVDTFKIRE